MLYKLEKVNVEGLTKYKGLTSKDREASAAMYITKEEFEKGMNKVRKVIEWYIITKELLPKLREVDSEEADRTEAILRDLY